MRQDFVDHEPILNTVVRHSDNDLHWTATSTADTQKVHVIQHSAGFNQGQTVRIDLVTDLSDYVNIPDGNREGNGSANFRENSSFFVDTALQSEIANEWTAAFDYLDPKD